MEKKISYDQFWMKLKHLSSEEILKNIVYLNPENRSSTIFPVFLDNNSETKLYFLSYWLKKANCTALIVLTIRNLSGIILDKMYRSITSYKSNTICISDLFNESVKGFLGSVEVEVFTKDKPLFRFPAITLSFSNKLSSSVVHSCIRTYNQGEKSTDESLNLPQTGFDVEFSKGKRNFICFFGGNSNFYDIEIKLSEGDFEKIYSLNIKNNKYGQTHIIYIEDLLDSNDIKIFNNPKCSILHNLYDVFPRFYTGMNLNEFVPTLTHTFFDTSNPIINNKISDKDKFRVKNLNPDIYFDAGFSIPIYPFEKFTTLLKSYAQNLDVKGYGLISIYSLQGELLFKRQFKEDELIDLCKVSEFDLEKLISEANLSFTDYYSLTFSFVNKEMPFPQRFKLGLNLKRKKSKIGTNICFSPVVMNETLPEKPFSRTWFPVGGYQNFVASVHNTSLSRDFLNNGNSYLFEFINHEEELLNRNIILKQNACIFIDPLKDNELRKFLGDKGGWCMVKSDSYCLNAYYFSLTNEVIGGDHAF